MPSRKPTSLLEISGAYQKNPSRRRPDEPSTGRGVGAAPKHLSDDQRAAWDDVVANCAAGVFQSSDRMMLEMLAVLIAEWRGDYAGFGGRKYTVLQTLLARAGMTPADRSRIAVKPPKGDNPFDRNGKRPTSGLASFR